VNIQCFFNNIYTPLDRFFKENVVKMSDIGFKYVFNIASTRDYSCNNNDGEYRIKMWYRGDREMNFRSEKINMSWLLWIALLT